MEKIIGIIFNELDEAIVTFPMKDVGDVAAVRAGLQNTRATSEVNVRRSTAEKFLLTRSMGGHKLLLVPVKFPNVPVKYTKSVPWHNAEDGEEWMVTLEGQSPVKHEVVPFGFRIEEFGFKTKGSTGEGISLRDRRIIYAEKL